MYLEYIHLRQSGKRFRTLHGDVCLCALALLIGNLNPFDTRRHSWPKMLLIETFLSCSVWAAHQG